jgi:hypothetical protein
MVRIHFPREESANHRFLSPHACDRRRRGQGEPFGAFQCGYQPGAAECCPPLGLPFARRPTIVSRCCRRCSHGRARPNMAMRKRTRRAMWRGCAAPIPTASRHGPKRMRRTSQRKEKVGSERVPVDLPRPLIGGSWEGGGRLAQARRRPRRRQPQHSLRKRMRERDGLAAGGMWDSNPLLTTKISAFFLEP